VIDSGSVLSSLSVGAGGGGVEVDFDATVFMMVGIFIFLWIVLKPLLFDPMLKLFEERERRGAKLQARKIDEKSVTALTQYEAEMAKARASASAERDKIRGEGVKREAEILAKVRAQTAATLEAGRKEMREVAAVARKGLGSEMPTIAADFASRALGREVRG
jgi:F-type H+-transporting ATPase subunit b